MAVELLAFLLSIKNSSKTFVGRKTYPFIVGGSLLFINQNGKIHTVFWYVRNTNPKFKKNRTRIEVAMSLKQNPSDEHRTKLSIVHS